MRSNAIFEYVLDTTVLGNSKENNGGETHTSSGRAVLGKSFTSFYTTCDILQLSERNEKRS
jgi:hypothetical protein